MSQDSQDNKSQNSQDNKSQNSQDNKSQNSQDNKSQNSQDNKSQNSQDNKSQNNTIQDAIIIIDMNKLPEEIREKFPKDLQDKLMELLQAGQQFNIQNISDAKPSGLFAVQQGYVAGNVYRDGKPVLKTKRQIIDEHTNKQEIDINTHTHINTRGNING